MSKSLGNIDRAAGHHQGERRRDPPAVGRDESTTARKCASASRSWRGSVEAYRKIRNTLRYLLANLYDFDPATRPGAARADGGGRSLRPRALRRRRGDGPATPTTRYDFPTIFQALNQFTTVDLSAFYADVSKDRLYTFAARLAGAALGADGDVPHRRRPDAAAGADPAVHRRRAVAAPAGPARGVGAPRRVPAARRGRDAASTPELVGALGAADRRPRDEVNAALEAARQGQDRSAARSARSVVAAAPSGDRRRCSSAIATTCRCCSSCRRSSLEVRDGRRGSAGASTSRARTGEKCARCWRMVDSISSSPDTDGLCDRCVDAVGGARAA